jgi:protein-glutamine gamma-glutamyltransferase
MFAASHLRSATIPLPVAIERYFEVAIYLLVFTAFGALGSTGGLDIPTVFLVAGALLFRGYLLATRRTLVISERWTTALTLIYVAFYLADYFLISGSFLNATVHLVLFVMVVRLFSAHRDRDYYFLAIIAFLMVLAAAVLTVDSIFLLAFAAFMLMAVVTFILMEMRDAAGKATIHSKDTTDARAYRHMAFSLAGASPVLVLFILLGAAGIFFILPRISAGYLSAYAPGKELSTGFSDHVQLGQIGEIQQSSSVVMHIQIDGDRGGEYDLKWRGVTLSLFDGHSWSNPHGQFVVPRLPTGGFLLNAPELSSLKRSAHAIHYRVLMEPVGTNVFFLAPTPRLLEGSYRTISMDGGGAVYDLDPEHPVNLYEASSVLSQPDPRDLRATTAPYPPEILLNYLQLPAVDPRIPQLAEQVTASFSNNYDKAQAVETYLRSKFGYTLQLSRTTPRDPLAEFLFERKRGPCEYFASAMAVMLRTQRIPARVVNGFRTGEFNDITSQYLVRASNAHSWVEVYFPGRGWISFDPTPAGPAEMHTGWGRAMLYLDAMASFWREWIIDYDASHQQLLTEGAKRSSLQIFSDIRHGLRHRYERLMAGIRKAQNTMSKDPGRWTTGGVLTAILLLLAANARGIWRLLRSRQLAARPEKSPRMAATIWYQRMIRRLAQQGWRKSPVQTPREFVECIEDSALRDCVEEFTRRYEGARFGDSAEDAGQLPHLFEEISTAGRR